MHTEFKEYILDI